MSTRRCPHFIPLAAVSLLLLIFAASPARASTASVVWMTITPGARPNGMGEAFTALSDDATASYWNPAGLAFVEQGSNEVTLQHSPWLRQLADDLYFEYLGYARYLEGWGGVGGNVTFMSMGEQQETVEGSPDPIGTFYSYGFAVTGAFGTEVAPGVAVGLGAKFTCTTRTPARGAPSRSISEPYTGFRWRRSGWKDSERLPWAHPSRTSGRT